eukprot:GHVU01144924.1.p1 GENE.GHVU01144924.1~~GHVU01144924.1.p1  ORF type:complete len:144 (-),score=38.97 GHVU01144924.1:104-535(-)
MRPPRMVGRDDLETKMLSSNVQDWTELSEMVLGPVPPGFTFLPKHKSSSYASRPTETTTTTRKETKKTKTTTKTRTITTLCDDECGDIAHESSYDDNPMTAAPTSTPPLHAAPESAAAAAATEESSEGAAAKRDSLLPVDRAS